MDIPMDTLKNFVGGLVIENLALQHRVTELEALQAEAAEPATEAPKRTPLKSVPNQAG